MAENEKIITIPSSENPAKKHLGNEALPDGYKGGTNNPVIVNLFNKGLQQGLTVEQMTKLATNIEAGIYSNGNSTVEEEEEEEEEDDNLRMFATRVIRFTPQVPQSKLKSTYWALKTIIDMENIDNHYLIADNYNKAFNEAGVIPDLSIFYTTLWNELNRASNVESMIKPVDSEKIVNFILLNKSLRDEGVVLPTREVLACSVRWDKQEIFFLLQQGTKLSEAIKLYDIGFKTVDEVVMYAGAIPETWVDLILN